MYISAVNKNNSAAVWKRKSLLSECVKPHSVVLVAVEIYARTQLEGFLDPCAKGVRLIRRSQDTDICLLGKDHDSRRATCLWKKLDLFNQHGGINVVEPSVECLHLYLLVNVEVLKDD